MNDMPAADRALVLSYLGLRKAIGIIGLALPFVLVIGKSLLDSPGILSSISAYYYSAMGDVLVGSLCAIGVFLLSYRGYARKDDRAGDLACVFAIGVALFPTRPALHPSSQQVLAGHVHYGCALAFFLTLAYFCLVLFCKTDARKPMTRRKRHRNVLYRVCGYTILICVGLLGLYAGFFQHTPLARLDPVFWLETIAILAFGLSWLTKGEAILRDEV